MAATRRRRSFEEWVNSPRVSGWSCVVLAVVCAVAAVVAYTNATALRDDGLVSEATVVEVHDGRDPYVLVRFTTAAGEEVEAQVGNWSYRTEPRVGDRQTVLYDPERPAGNVADTRSGPDFLACWLLAGGAVLAAVVARLSFAGRIDWMRWRR